MIVATEEYHEQFACHAVFGEGMVCHFLRPSIDVATTEVTGRGRRSRPVCCSTRLLPLAAHLLEPSRLSNCATSTSASAHLANFHVPSWRIDFTWTFSKRTSS